MENFGVRDKVLETHQEKGNNIEKLTQNSYRALMDDIKEKTANETDKYVPIVVKEMKFSEDAGLNRAARPLLLYRLQSNPNLVSRLEPEVGNKKLAAKMRPISFRWVSEEEKLAMGFQGLAVKGLQDRHIDFLDQKISNPKTKTIDILKCFAYLIANHADEAWVNLDVLKVTYNTMLPLENSLKALRELMDSGAIIVGTYEVSHARRGGHEYKVKQ